MTILCFAEELAPKIRVCDVDQGLRTFADTLAPELGDAVLRDDVVHVTTARDHAGPFFEHALDAAHAAVPGRRGQRDDRPPAAAASSAAYEVNLPANPGKEATRKRVGRDLSREIDGQRRVDRDHAVVLG